MLRKFTFAGTFAAGSRQIFEGDLNVYLGSPEITICPPRRHTSGESFHLCPFQGSMLFGRTYSEGCRILERGYELHISGTDVGLYEDGGGMEGNFDEFTIENAHVRGNFDSRGLTVSIAANTFAGSKVCYNSGEKQEGAYEPLVVQTQFLVPPPHLSPFLALGIPLSDKIFAKFQWPTQ
jgi:hypothetical protein